MKRDRPTIKLPFPGFYESWLTYEMDHAEESFLENFAENEREDYVRELHVADETGELLWQCIDHRKVCEHLAKQFATQFDNDASNELGFKLGLTFEAMSSPKFYNYETDRLFAFIPVKTLRRLFAISKENEHAELGKVIAKRHTSRSGFHSYYEDELNAWLAKPVRDWDHNELETLLIACLHVAGIDPKKFEREVCEHMSEAGDFLDAFDKGCDFAKFDAGVVALREAREAELRANDPDYVEPAVRCPLTLDLFQNR